MDDVAQLMYRFDSGASAIYEGAWCMPNTSPFDLDERMSVIGTEGFIHIQDTFPPIAVCSKEGFKSPDTTYWPELHGVTGGVLRDEWSYFTRCNLDGTRPDGDHAGGGDGDRADKRSPRMNRRPAARW